jgi:SSS family solute:Na+ symporter
MVINGAFYAIQKYGTDQTVVQRYLSAKTDKSAQSVINGHPLNGTCLDHVYVIGTALFVFYQQKDCPGMKSEEVFPYFMMTELPVGVIGFIVAALISAAICSPSADLNSMAAVGVEDYYKRARPGCQIAICMRVNS